MNKLMLFEITLFAIVVVGSLSGLISYLRAGQVFLGIGVIDLIFSLVAWRGWPVLRGDASNLAPLDRRDTHEPAPGGNAADRDRPSTGFAIQMAEVGIIAIIAGLAYILLLA